MGSATPEKHPVRVTILHQSYTLLTSGDDREVQELADSVNELMSAIAAKAAGADNLRVAVLACFHLADRLRSLERELVELKQRVDEKSREFRLLLDQAIQESDAGE